MRGQNHTRRSTIGRKGTTLAVAQHHTRDQYHARRSGHASPALLCKTTLHSWYKLHRTTEIVLIRNCFRVEFLALLGQMSPTCAGTVSSRGLNAVWYTSMFSSPGIKSQPPSACLGTEKSYSCLCLCLVSVYVSVSLVCVGVWGQRVRKARDARRKKNPPSCRHAIRARPQAASRDHALEAACPISDGRNKKRREKYGKQEGAAGESDAFRAVGVPA
eukprot:115978-Rhodomonas_salina.2